MGIANACSGREFLTHANLAAEKAAMRKALTAVVRGEKGNLKQMYPRLFFSRRGGE